MIVYDRNAGSPRLPESREVGQLDLKEEVCRLLRVG